MMKYVATYVIILLLSVLVSIGAATATSVLVSNLVEFLSYDYGYVFVIMVGYIALLGAALAAAGLFGFIHSLTVLYWIFRNFKDYSLYMGRLEQSSTTKVTLREWLEQYSLNHADTSAIPDDEKLATRHISSIETSEDSTRYEPAFYSDMAGFVSVWMAVTSSGKEYIMARIKIGGKHPHFIVNSIIESGDLLTREYKNGVRVNLEGDLNDYFSVICMPGDEGEVLKILPPDVLQSLVGNLDEFDLESTGAHLNIFMNPDRDEILMDERIARIKKFILELSPELNVSNASTDSSNLVLTPLRTWYRRADTAVSAIFRAGKFAYVIVFVLLFILGFILTRSSLSSVSIPSDIITAVTFSFMITLILVTQWLLSSVLFTFAVLSSFLALQKMKYRLRREFYVAKHHFYYTQT